MKEFICGIVVGAVALKAWTNHEQWVEQKAAPTPRVVARAAAFPVPAARWIYEKRPNPLASDWRDR
jgi:hypothetical protein